MKKYVEIKYDLFKKLEEESANKVVTMHCISECLGMKRGIAVPFNEIYDIRNKIRNIYKGNKIGFPTIIPLCYGNLTLINLVTKEKAWHKPTFEDFEHSLRLSLSFISEDDKIIIPKIGAGLDKLDWNKIKNLLITLFPKNEIIVCYIN